ncbi:MAG: hypothetical protein WCD70_02860 [Alphaproteobacteria bacterium]
MGLFPLPDIMLLENHKGDWESYRIAIYQEFMEHVVRANHSFLGLPISYQRNPEYLGMHCSFWHLITEDLEKTHRDEDRTPDMRRCERVSWIGHILRHATDPQSGILCWENKRGANAHVVLWIKEEDFVIILAKRKSYYLLKTIYQHNQWAKEKLEAEHQRYLDPRKD